MYCVAKAPSGGVALAFGVDYGDVDRRRDRIWPSMGAMNPVWITGVLIVNVVGRSPPMGGFINWFCGMTCVCVCVCVCVLILYLLSLAHPVGSKVYGRSVVEFSIIRRVARPRDGGRFGQFPPRSESLHPVS